jgi:RNA polymerase sigma factor (sigma-70 family)
MDDRELLQEFVRNRSQDAFSELVGRHLPMVYSAARRMVRDSQLAEDIAQNVFTVLAQKASSLEASSVVGGWLYCTTRNLSLHTIRSEQRRRQREETVVAMNALQSSDNDRDTALVTEHLDLAMAELESAERDALVLRFLEDRSLRAVGQELGISEDAARMRVNRALDKLRGVLERQGVPVSAVLLASALTATTSAAVPAGLAPTVTTVALAGVIGAATATTSATLTATATHISSMFTAKAIAVLAGAVIVAGGGTYFVQQTKLQQLKAENEKLAAVQEQSAADHEAALKSLRAASQPPALADADKTELLRLRNEVAQLRRERAAEKGRTVPGSPAPASPRLPTKTATKPGAGYVTRDQLAFLGYSTPENALQSMTWAMTVGTYEQTLTGLAPELQKEELKDSKGRENFETQRPKMGSQLKGIEILARKNLAADRVELKARYDLDNPSGGQPIPDLMIQPMIKVGDEWKVGGSTRSYDQTWEKDGDVVTLNQ